MNTKKTLVAALAAMMVLFAAGCDNGLTAAMGAVVAGQQEEQNPVPVESVTLDKSMLTLKPNTTGKLTATVLPENADDKTVTWSSDDPSVATVASDGTVTAVNFGETNIYAQAGEKVARCWVTVKNILVEVYSVTLNETMLTLKPDTTGKLTATVLPEDADDKTVTWSSSDTSVATVDSDGTVTAVSIGDAYIYAQAGDKWAECWVTVKNILVEVYSVTLDKSMLTLEHNMTEKLTATVLPEDADDKTVTWSSSDSSVATVDENGTVTAVGIGKTTISAQAGNKMATCQVIVSLNVEGFKISDNGTLTKYTGTEPDVKIPDGVRSIGSGAFSGCTSLESVTIPGSVKTIGGGYFSKGAFQGCTSLKSVTLAEGVEQIGSAMFAGCESLASVTIPDSVTSIGDSAFSRCTSLASLTIPASVTSIGDSAFYGCTGLESLTIPASVESIGNNAFHGCTSLESVTILEGVTSIGGAAFSGCTNLASVTIPASVTSIGSSTFRECTSLTEIQFNGTVAQWQAIEGSGGVNVTCVFCTDGHIGVEKVPEYLKMSGTVVTGYTDALPADLKIPDGVTSIGSNAFSGSWSLVSVTIPASVTSIGELAFVRCWILETINYTGTQEQWNAITININSGLSDKTINGKDAAGNDTTWTCN